MKLSVDESQSSLEINCISWEGSRNLFSISKLSRNYNCPKADTSFTVCLSVCLSIQLSVLKIMNRGLKNNESLGLKKIMNHSWNFKRFWTWVHFRFLYLSSHFVLSPLKFYYPNIIMIYCCILLVHVLPLF